MMKQCLFCKEKFECISVGTRYCSINCYYDFHVVKNKTGCWDWKGVRLPYGYGKMARGRGNIFLAHRFSYERFVGPIPEGMFVLHKCDNPPCTKPEHLFVGTLSDNTQDCIRKGRHSSPPKSPKHFKNTENWKRGSKHYEAKITEKQAVYILRSKMSGVALAKKFGVSPSAISALRKRKTWKHVVL